MRRLSVALIAAASTIAFSQIASAADLGRPVYKAPPPPPPPVSDWSGVYVGGEGGYGWGDQSVNATDPGDVFEFILPAVSAPTLGPTVSPVAVPFPFPDVAIPSTKQRGWLFGGFFGAQKQWGSWVFGIEGDLDDANIKGSGTSSASSDFFSISPPPPFLKMICEDSPCLTLNHDLSIDSKIDMLASLRGKVGFVPAPDWLIYGTGGAAFAHVTNTITSTETAVNNVFDPTLTSGTSMFGWAAGAGVDWKLPLDAGSALVFGVEYLHYGFPEQTITLADNAGSSLAFNAKENVDTVKGRISYLFSIH